MWYIRNCSAVCYVKSTLGVPVPGALVIAIRQSDSITISGVSGPDGFYVLYNIPEGTYEMQASLSGWYQATRVINIGVTRQTVTSGADIQLTANAGTSLSGRVTFLAAQNSEVDITLAHIISHILIYYYIVILHFFNFLLPSKKMFVCIIK